MNPMVAILVLAAAQAQSSWQELGGSASDQGLSGTPGAPSTNASIALDAAGRPVVAYYDSSSGRGEIYVRRWTGTTWAPYIDKDNHPSDSDAGISSSTKSGFQPWVALDAAGSPVIAWEDDVTPDGATTSVYRVLLKRWRPATSEWTGMEAGSSYSIVNPGSGHTNFAEVAIDPSGWPVVSWADFSGGSGLPLVRHWDGSPGQLKWTGFASSDLAPGLDPTPGMSTSNVVMALDSSGRPTVAWNRIDNWGKMSVCLRQWNGSAWIELGGSMTGTGIAPADRSAASAAFQWPSLALTSAGQPIVAWNDNSSGHHEIYLRRYDATSRTWTGMDGISSIDQVSQPGLTIAFKSRFAFLVVDRQDRPSVAWTERANLPTPNYEIYLRRWSGSTWEELGGSGSGGGISNTDGVSSRPCMAVDRHGFQSVAWFEGVLPSPPNANEVYLRRYSPPALPPDDPVLSGQFHSNGMTALGLGSMTDRLGAAFSATADDLNGGLLRLQVEIQPVGSSFTGAVSATGAPAPAGTPLWVSATGLADETSFHWRARVIDETDLTSGWVNFGENLESEADFTTPVNHAPVATRIEQVQVWDRGVVSTLLVDAVMVDPDPEDQVKLELEIRRVEEAFTGIPTVEGALVASGTPVEINVLKMLDGFYKWRYQTRDSLGKTSGWISYGTNSDSEADFAFPPFGSSGHAKCANSAATAGPPWALLGGLAILAAAALIAKIPV